jgi:hypothetical protein
MNQRLVESLAQIILSLSEEEQQLLESKVQKSAISQQVTDLEHRLKSFEEKYQMPSEHFYQRFQAGEIGDSMDFFEWSTYYEMWNSARVKASQIKWTYINTLLLLKKNLATARSFCRLRLWMSECF